MPSSTATRLLTDLAGELAGAFGVPLLRRRIPKEVKVRNAANLDAPVGQAYPGPRAAIMYRVLAEEVLATIGREPDVDDALVEAVS